MPALMIAPDRSRSGWLCAGAGLFGSTLIAYAAPRAIADPVVGWWYVPHWPGHDVSLALVYAGMAILCAAWLALGRALPAPRRLLVIGAVWALPLALAPPLFSRDIFGYLAQAAILHLGHDPYHSAPQILAGLGHPRLVDAVSPIWRGTASPYGPLFLGIVGVIVGAMGSHLVAGVLLVRSLDLIGAGLLAVSVCRLTRALGGDTRRALWLVVLSPLLMLELVAAGHNDVLMAGLLAAGVACALSGRPLLGIAICTLAGTIKVPGLAGAVFIAVAWGRAEPTRGQRLRFALTAGGIVLVVLAAVTVVSGAGTSWVSPSVFATPARVRLAITPATALGYTVASLLRDVGVTTTGRGLEAALGALATVMTALVAVLLLYRVRIPRLAALLGTLLLIAAATGPAAWPWYFIWGLALIGVLGTGRAWAPAAAIVVAVFLVRPDGVLALPLPTAPAVLVVYAAIATAAWLHHGRRATGGGHDPPACDGGEVTSALPGAAPSALAGM